MKRRLARLRAFKRLRELEAEVERVRELKERSQVQPRVLSDADIEAMRRV